jgi:dTDP-4-amino-4,6-dideoxygalactose transaminase
MASSTGAVVSSVPFIDLGPAHAPLRDEILEEIAALIDRNEFATGETVIAFERAFAAYCGTGDCVGTSSGLDALRLALIAAGLTLGDEVLVPANTFFATFEAVTQAGGVPVPVDASPDDYNIDVGAAAAAAGPRTRVLMPVHLYGQLADMRGLLRLAAQHDLVTIEDAAQAHGAVRDGYAPGMSSAGAAFSFYPAKNLGAMGDAGAVTTNDASIAETVRTLREHGQREKYVHELIGWTARLDAVQAAVLSVKLRRLDEWNEQRRIVAAAYSEELDGVGDLRLPPVAPGSEPVWHLYVVRTSNRDALAWHLGDRGIGVARHYPQPPHLSPAYVHLGYRPGDFPFAEQLAAEALSLPMYPGIRDDQVTAVVSAVKSYFAGA